MNQFSKIVDLKDRCVEQILNMAEGNWQHSDFLHFSEGAVRALANAYIDLVAEFKKGEEVYVLEGDKIVKCKVCWATRNSYYRLEEDPGRNMGIYPERLIFRTPDALREYYKVILTK